MAKKKEPINTNYFKENNYEIIKEAISPELASFVYVEVLTIVLVLFTF